MSLAKHNNMISPLDSHCMVGELLECEMPKVVPAQVAFGQASRRTMETIRIPVLESKLSLNELGLETINLFAIMSYHSFLAFGYIGLYNLELLWGEWLVGATSSGSLSIGGRTVCGMDVEDWASSSGDTSDSEGYVQDRNDEEHYFTSDDIHKLQFRKNISRAKWDEEMGVAEVVEKKGGMWTTTGIVHGNMYRKIAEGKNGCYWESFEVHRHLRSLGYVVGRHGVPWTMKSVKNASASVEDMSENKVIIDQKFKGLHLVNELFNNMQINEVRPAFDVYPPNSKFRKSSPGDPIFVLCLPSGHPPSKPEIEDLERRCNGIPLKFCHVEHGRVSFFSFNRVELPVIP
ncbi:hypothetical protein Acr_09g0001290 [Actinidia rufa]|uniref:tRNA-splicing endonuclease subunit Sen54 N-terminal domain-containing protein n=1 Tax=Actinidia rufa TaxID=165716 RepID=A0A7J0F516_9ERIC|nr:hypothetical protein Acr_09g0001290 [Actinidia rufa]